MNNNLFMMLALINEHMQLSGYSLNKLIEYRGYRAWADIGSTSIYVNLKKLSKLDYIEGKRNEHANANGMSSNLYSCTSKGITALKTNTRQALTSAREHDRSFDLALSTCNILTKVEIINSLKSRIEMLLKEITRIEKIKVYQVNDMSFQGLLLFNRTEVLIENEIDYTRSLIDRIEKEMN
jgi:DNA-binding PadR family transcriptional regulator